jgi:hypothetical protein
MNEMTAKLPLIISALSMIVSILGYLRAVRIRQAFYLVRINNVGSIQPEFALINGGNEDLLITTLHCGFSGNDNSFSVPKQEVDNGSNSSYLLHAGKSFYCRIRFIDKFPPSFVKRGTLDPKRPDYHLMDMSVNVEWIDSKGKSYEKRVKLTTYGFKEDGHMGYSAPLIKRQDLYAAK